jgi:hypothetical protein
MSVNENELTLLASQDPDRIVAALEDLFRVHWETYGKHHYCINIKIHCLPLTWQQEQKAFANLEAIWDIFIRPWIADFETETDHRIYSEGRSGGYLYVEGISEVLEPDEMLEAQDDDEEPSQISEWTREKLETLLKFKNEWERLLKDIKAWLNERPAPRDE